MDYRKFGECYYIRMDRNDEIISTILEICKKENIRSATFSGIGGCKDAEIQTFIPETGSFEEQRISGMLELVSLNGNVVTGENNTCYHHTHAVFSYKDGERHCMEMCIRDRECRLCKIWDSKQRQWLCVTIL